MMLVIRLDIAKYHCLCIHGAVSLIHKVVIRRFYCIIPQGVPKIVRCNYRMKGNGICYEF